MISDARSLKGRLKNFMSKVVIPNLEAKMKHKRKTILTNS